MVLLRRGGTRWAACTLTAALLTRETTAIFAAAMVARIVVGSTDDQPASRLPMIVPVAVFVAWQGTLAFIWGHIPIISGPPAFSWPIVGVVGFGIRLVNHLALLERVWLVAVAMLVGVAAAAATASPRSMTGRFVKYAWMRYGVMALCFSLAAPVEIPGACARAGDPSREGARLLTRSASASTQMQ